jgi:hypothetical protein
VDVAVLPRSLLEAFLHGDNDQHGDDDRHGWGKLLLFLSPITLSGGLSSEVSR